MIGWRSALFVPSDAGERVAKAADRGADAVILDLEDGVAPVAKPAARNGVAEQARMLSGRGVAVVVRINAGWRLAIDDLAASAGSGIDAVMVPKCEDPGRLAVIGEILDEIEAERGLAAGAIGIVALIESPRGVAAAPALAAVPRVIALALGSEDFSLAMGVEPTATALALPTRQIALAAAAQGIMALAIPISIAAISDEPGWRAAAAEARAFGATGALCIHPRQVAIANAAFTPADEEIADAAAVVKAWQDAGGDAAGVATLNGRMIDRPVIERARRIMARASVQTGQKGFGR